MYNVRHFNKEKYYLDDWFETRKEAKYRAMVIRRAGNSARIVSKRTGNRIDYFVYFALK